MRGLITLGRGTSYFLYEQVQIQLKKNKVTALIKENILTKFVW